MNNGDLSALNTENGQSAAINRETSESAVIRAALPQTPPGIKAQMSKKLHNVIQKARLVDLRDEYEPGTKLNNVIAAWLEIFLSLRIPPEAINACYIAAEAHRIKTGNETGFFPRLDCGFIAAQWSASVRAKHDQKNKGRRLAVKKISFANCPDCFGNSFGKKYTTISGRVGLTDEFCTHENFVAGDGDE